MKQLFTTKYVSFMAVSLMAAMSLGSCSNDDEPGTTPTGTTLARITMVVTGLPQTKQSADNVNKGTTPKDIENIVLVPMLNNGTTDTWLDAINLGKLEASKGAIDGDYMQPYKNVAIPRGVNRFRVYGGEAAKVSAPITATAQFQLATAGTEGTQTVYAPAGLYYYTETQVAQTSGIQDLTIEGPSSAREAAVSETTEHIAITGVRYGVGLLTTKVSVDPNITYIDETGAAADPVETASFTGELTLTGLFVSSQPEMVDAQFEPMEADGKTRIVKDEAINSAIIEKNGTASAVTTVNNYTTLFQTKGEEQATVVLRVTSTVDIYAKSASGAYEKVEIGEPFYVRAVLAPANATSGDAEHLFQKFYETKANLKINSLANATTELPDITPTDVNLDVTVDLSWEAGFTFDETID